MKVLKFGGTSVANAQNILLVEKIVRKESSENRVVVVVSALSGVTDGLISAAESASAKNENYSETIKTLEEKHLEFVKNLLPITEQSSWLSFVKKNFNDIEDICNGIYVLGEFTPRIKDKITAYGEFLSSNIIAAKLKSDGLDCVWLDSRNYIKTNSNFTDAKVDFEKKNANFQNYFKENKQQVTRPQYY